MTLDFDYILLQGKHMEMDTKQNHPKGIANETCSDNVEKV